jgi:hypothetical protein
VFQKIFNSPDLKGTLFVPTQAAWVDFFATLRQRKGNPESPQLIARYGQVMLYHLAQDDNYRGVKVPIAEATPGISRFLVSTASTLQCSVGTGLPNNRLLITKTPQAIVVSGCMPATGAACVQPGEGIVSDASLCGTHQLYMHHLTSRTLNSTRCGHPVI